MNPLDRQRMIMMKKQRKAKEAAEAQQAAEAKQATEALEAPETEQTAEPKKATAADVKPAKVEATPVQAPVEAAAAKKPVDQKKQRLVAFVVAAVMVAALVLVLCLTLIKGKIVWTDKLESDGPETIDVTSPSIKLPEIPAISPSTNKSSPTTFAAATVGSDCYTLTSGSGNDGLFTVSYKSDDPLPAYAYVYIPVTNYNGAPYLKIKANCESVERVAILAVYYEQYQASRPAVTVYNNAVMEGDNLIICKLGECALLDSHYAVATGEKLTQKSVCGFMIMLDSNPKQVIDEYSGKFTVASVAAVDENDPDLSMLYSAPYISGWKASEGFASSNITTQRIEGSDGVNAEVAYSVAGQSPRIEAAIANYKSDYTTVKMDIKGDNVQTLTIAIKYTLKSSADNIDYNYLSSFNMSVGSNWETMEFDFSTLEELKQFAGDVTVPGSYVKNLNPTAIYFFVDSGKSNSGKLSVRNVTFSKPETGGAPRVTSTWTTGAQGITKSGVAEGGKATLVYNKTQGWFPVTASVASFDPDYSLLVVRVKFYDENSNLGIAVGYGSSNVVVLQSKGMTPPDGFGVRLVSHTSEKGNDDKGEYTFHTFTIDIKFATTSKGGSDFLVDESITKLMFYIDAAEKDGSNWIDLKDGKTLDPARTMEFVEIKFEQPK